MVIYNRLPSKTEKQHCVKSVRVASVSVQSWGGGSGGGRSIAHQSARFGTGRGSLASVRKAAKAPSRAETFMIRRGVNLKEVGFEVFIVSLHWCSVVLITVNCWFNRVQFVRFKIVIDLLLCYWVQAFSAAIMANRVFTSICFSNFTTN